MRRTSAAVNREKLAAPAVGAYYHGMKFFAAIVVYILIGLVLGIGIIEAVKGHFWFLAAGIIVYVISFAKIGCLPSSKSH